MGVCVSEAGCLVTAGAGFVLSPPALIPLRAEMTDLCHYCLLKATQLL